jgi:hypothetical protein
MGKYEPLTRFLSGRSTVEVPMTFQDIERVLGARLPASKRYPAWWSNNPSNNVMTKAWLDAGYQTERVDIGGERLVFRRVGPSKEHAGSCDKRSKSSLLERIRGRLAGAATIPAGVDVTAPSDETWDASR